MINHFYEITEENSAFKEYFDYLEKDKKMRADVKAFMNTYNIKSSGYILYNGKLYVEPELNKQLYSEQFGKERLEGLAPFKKNSPIGKAFTEKGIKRANKPFIPWCFKNPVGRCSFSLFDYKNRLYCKYDTEFEVEDTPKGFHPMKGSEFYKALEEAKEAEKAEQ